MTDIAQRRGVHLPFEKFFTLGGDGITHQVAEDWSVTPGEFQIAPPAGEIWCIRTVHMVWQDTGVWSPDGFGVVSTPLTNGVELELVVEGTSHSLTPEPIYTNLDVWTHATTVEEADIGLPNFDTKIIKAIWNFEFYNEEITRLIGLAGDMMRFKVSDDLSDLDEMHFVAHGYDELQEV